MVDPRRQGGEPEGVLPLLLVVGAGERVGVDERGDVQEPLREVLLLGGLLVNSRGATGSPAKITVVTPASFMLGDGVGRRLLERVRVEGVRDVLDDLDARVLERVDRLLRVWRRTRDRRSRCGGSANVRSLSWQLGIAGELGLATGHLLREHLDVVEAEPARW